MSRWNSTAAFTIVARNYLAYAAVLLASLEAKAPDIERFVFLIDDLAGETSFAEGTVILPQAVFNLETYLGMAVRYDVTELSTAVKPFVLRYLLGLGFGSVLYFDPDIEVIGSLDPVRVPLRTSNAVLTPHTTEAIPLDGKLPDERELLRSGAYNLGFIGVANRTAVRRMLDWWAERLEQYCINSVADGLFVDQKWIDLVPGMLERVELVRHRGCNVAYWNLHSRRIDPRQPDRLRDGTRLVFFHYSGFDARNTEKLSKYQTRIELADEPGLRALLESYAGKLISKGHLNSIGLPYPFRAFANGVPLDPTSRSILRKAHSDGIRFGDPFEVGAAPSAWSFLNESMESRADREPQLTRYLVQVVAQRLDLQGAFPDLFGAAHASYINWLQTETRHGIPPAYFEEAGIPLNPRLKSLLCVNSGVTVAGYFKTESGVGEAGRARANALRAGGVPVELVDFSSHAVSRGEDSSLRTTSARADYPINLVCVNADQVDVFRSEVGPAFFSGRYNIGSWWWELPEFPDRWTPAFKPFDEIWVGSQFIASSLARKSPVPVVLVPPIVDVGFVKHVPKAHFGFSDEETVFLFMFDYLSVFERKNPLAVIDAFRRAFHPNEKVRLVIKAINVEYDVAGGARLREASGDDQRIEIIDRYFSREEKNRLLAVCDAYVSLHRSEGFGYTPAEAMALGRPVIATAWSGNMDYMTVSNSFPVAYKLKQIESDHGPYEAGQYWADPDVNDAARAMRAVFELPAEATRRGNEGRADIAARFSAVASGRIAADRIDLIKTRRRSLIPQ